MGEDEIKKKEEVEQEYNDPRDEQQQQGPGDSRKLFLKSKSLCCSIRPIECLYILVTTCFPVEVTRASSRNSFLNKVHYYPDRPPYEQIPYQGDYCLSRHHLIHDANCSGQDRHHLQE